MKIRKKRILIASVLLILIIIIAFYIVTHLGDKYKYDDNDILLYTNYASDYTFGYYYESDILYLTVSNIKKKRFLFFFSGGLYENDKEKYGNHTYFELENTLKEAAIIPDFYRGGAKRFNELGYTSNFSELYNAVWNDDIFYIWDNKNSSTDMMFIPITTTGKGLNDYGDYISTDGVINFFEEYELKTGKQVRGYFYITENYQVVMIYKIDKKLYLHQFN